MMIEKKPKDDETLNTPGPKRSRNVVGSKEESASQEQLLNSTVKITSEYETKTQTSTFLTAITTTTPTRPSVQSKTNPPSSAAVGVVASSISNNKNILPKSVSTTASASTIPHIKLTPKTNVNIAGGVAPTKTAVKTANGQIIYIQKATAGTGVATNAAVSATGNKTVAIQVLRSADGTLVPIKTPTIGATTTTTVGTKTALTLSPKMATQLAGKKIITSSGNQVLIKAPIKSPSAATTDLSGSTIDAAKTKVTKIVPVGMTTMSANNTLATATTSTAITKTTPTTSGKIVVQSANGKQIVVSNQNIIKLSPKPTNASGQLGSSGAGQLQAIHIPGKSGLQYVRVLAAPKTGVFSSVTETTTTSGGNVTTSASTTGAPIKIFNSAPQKFTVVRPSTGSSKMFLTQSPKKDGVPVTFSPITTKVQKTFVTVPTLRKIDDSNSALATSSPPPSIENNTVHGIKTASNSGTISLVRKHKISEINSQIQRMATGSSSQPETKKTSTGNRIVVMSRSMLRNNNTPPTLHKFNIKDSGSGNQDQQKRIIAKVQSTSSGSSNLISTSTSASTSNSSVSNSPKKYYSILKSNVETPHPVELKTNAELKSLIICGQAQALMAQQKQHKAQQMLQKQRLLHQQQQLQQQKQRQHQQQQDFLHQQQLTQQQLKQQMQQNKFAALKIKQELGTGMETNDVMSKVEEETVGAVRRKHCNCTKSQCLKLYCDCFANGEFCQDCNCKDCFNNLQYEDERQRAIRSCLERNPSAFKPKITTAQDQSDMRLHNKGCNCKRSGCLKNYCECYEAKIPCSSNCKCFGCGNIEDRPDLDMDPIDSKILATLANSSTGHSLAGQKRTYEKMDKTSKQLKDSAKTITAASNNIDAISGSGTVPTAEKQQCNFITQEVIDATIQCMISQADECEKNGLPAYQTEKMVMEELGRCLVEIIDFSIRNTDSSYTQD